MVFLGCRLSHLTTTSLSPPIQASSVGAYSVLSCCPDSAMPSINPVEIATFLQAEGLLTYKVIVTSPVFKYVANFTTNLHVGRLRLTLECCKIYRQLFYTPLQQVQQPPANYRHNLCPPTNLYTSNNLHTYNNLHTSSNIHTQDTNLHTDNNLQPELDFISDLISGETFTT